MSLFKQKEVTPNCTNCESLIIGGGAFDHCRGQGEAITGHVYNNDICKKIYSPNDNNERIKSLINKLDEVL
jgi:hypothetical protein